MRVALKVDDCSHRGSQFILVSMLECFSYGERDRKECFKNVNARDICFRLRSADLCTNVLLLEPELQTEVKTNLRLSKQKRRSTSCYMIKERKGLSSTGRGRLWEWEAQRSAMREKEERKRFLAVKT